MRGEAPQISPDGRHLVFSSTDRAGTRGLYIRSLDAATPRLLPGTENGAQPFWSPDSRMLGFFADGQLKTVAIAGGTPRVLARSGLARGAAWSKDNLILFAPRPNAGLVVVPASGGEPVPVPMPPTIGIPGFPSFLPDGRHYLITDLNNENRLVERLLLGSLDAPETRPLVATSSSGVYASGYLLYRRNTTLLAQRFDETTLQLSGEPVAIAEDVGYNPVTFQALFSASNTGVLAYRDAAPGAQLVWFSRSGLRLGTVGAAGEFNSLCMTPDGRRIVYEQADAISGNIDMWTMDLATAATTQLTFAGPVEFYPVCAPNGRDIALAVLKPNNPNLFRQSLSAPGQIVSLFESPLPKLPTDWSRDGTQLIFSVLSPATGWDVASLSLATGQPRPLVATPAQESNAKLSPDGRWLAYVSNESGRVEVYVQAMGGGGGEVARVERRRHTATVERRRPAALLHRAGSTPDGRRRSRRRRGVHAVGPRGAHGNTIHRMGDVGRRVLRGGAGWQPRAREHVYRHRPSCLAAAELDGAGSLTPVNRGSPKSVVNPRRPCCTSIRRVGCSPSTPGTLSSSRVCPTSSSESSRHRLPLDETVTGRVFG